MPPTPALPLRFTETQSFLRSWWPLLLLPVLLVVFLPVLGTVYGPGRGPATGLVTTTGAITALLIAFLLLTLRLETQVDATGINYRMRPFQGSWRHLPWAAIRTAQVRTYSPIGEYGGWGFKGTARNRAYNVAGSAGLQLELTDGSRLLLGTQQPEALRQVLADLGHLPEAI